MASCQKLSVEAWIAHLEPDFDLENPANKEFIEISVKMFGKKLSSIYENYGIALGALWLSGAGGDGGLQGSFNGMQTAGGVSSIREGDLAVSFGGAGVNEGANRITALKGNKWGEMLAKLLNAGNAYIGVTGRHCNAGDWGAV